MTVKEASTKERIIRRLEKLDEDALRQVEARLDEIERPSPETIERRLDAWRGVFGMLADPEDYAEFERHARRRSLFGGRMLDLEPDDA